MYSRHRGSCFHWNWRKCCFSLNGSQRQTTCELDVRRAPRPMTGDAMSTRLKRDMGDQENKQPEIVPPEPERSSERSQREPGRRRHRSPPKHLEASINMNELRELIGLITENGLTDFELEREGFRVKVGRGAHEDASAAAIPGAIEKQIASGSAAQIGGAGQSVPASAAIHPCDHAEGAASADQALPSSS